MITSHQQQQIVLAHTDGHLDREIAQRAGVSLATVKRVRKDLGLATHSKTAQRGRLGEQLTAAAATWRGLTTHWRRRDNDKHDMLISGQRVEVKTAMQQANGSWHFRLPRTRVSFYGQYRYTKDYARDCEVVVLCCLHPDAREPDFYLLPSAGLPTSVTIRAGKTYLGAREDWGLLAAPALPLAA
jgi:hypothetical protein